MDNVQEYGTFQIRKCRNGDNYAQVNVNSIYDGNTVDTIRNSIKLICNVRFINIRSTFNECINGVNHTCTELGYGEPINCEIVLDTSGNRIIQMSYNNVVTYNYVPHIQEIGYKWCEHPYLIDVKKGVVTVAINHDRKFGDFTPTVETALEAGRKYARDNNIWVSCIHVNNIVN